MSGTPTGAVEPAGQDTEHRWNELVRGYTAPGSGQLLDQAPERIPRAPRPCGSMHRASQDADAHHTWEMTRFGRWLVARAHLATTQAAGVEAESPEIAARMAEALYHFTDDVRRLERLVMSSSPVADFFGRLVSGRAEGPQVQSLLEAQSHILRALELFESTARELILSARLERPPDARPSTISVLLSLQAEAVTRGRRLALLDGQVPS